MDDIDESETLKGDAREKSHEPFINRALRAFSNGPYFERARPWKRSGAFVWNAVLKWAAGLVLVCLLAETISPTAYGRFGDESYIAMDSRVGWWLMELPCSIVFVWQFWVVGGPQSNKFVPRCLAVAFMGHYLYRGWIFPYLIRTHGNTRNFSVVPAIFSWIVTCTHAYLNAKWFSTYGTHLDMRWVRHRFFKIAIATYYLGFALIVWHDKILRELRPCPNNQRYCVPHGALFSYATCAQYFVELLAWTGWFAMSGGPNGAFILCVSLANLIPRAYLTHGWYESHFGDEYTSLGRSRLVPFVW